MCVWKKGNKSKIEAEARGILIQCFEIWQVGHRTSMIRRVGPSSIKNDKGTQVHTTRQAATFFFIIFFYFFRIELEPITRISLTPNMKMPYSVFFFDGTIQYSHFYYYYYFSYHHQYSRVVNCYYYLGVDQLN